MGERTTVIHGRRDVNHARVRFDERNEGEEEEAIQTVLVQILGCVVARGEHDAARLEKGFEDVGEDQRIGDVRHLVITTTQQHYMELVKTNEDV